MSLGMWIVAFCVVVTLLTVLHHRWEAGRSSIVFLGVALGVGATFLQVHTFVDRSGEEVAHSRLDIAFAYMEEWNRPEMVNTLRQANQAVDSAHGVEAQTFQAYLDRNSDKWTSLLKVLTYFEKVGLAVETGFVDEGAVCEYLRGETMRIYTVLGPWLDYQRESNENLYEHYDTLYTRWRGKDCPGHAA